MVRLFGRSFGSKTSSSAALTRSQQPQPPRTSRSRNNKQKKRLSPSARTPQGRREHHPMFQYALDEYAQTVVPRHGDDDDGQEDLYDDDGDNTTRGNQQQQQPEDAEDDGASRLSSLNPSGSTDHLPPPPPPTRGALRNKPAAISSSSTTNPAASSSSFCYYEESFAPAYTGGLISYVYPSGYQSMRPRSAPWKLSIVVFVLFTWLSVFIVGHCSDAAAAASASASNNNQQQQQNQADDLNAAMAAAYYDDDTTTINYNARWCGSRPLYGLWVASMLITGLAASYCSIIGYIKVRDFSVANVRSQPCASDGSSGMGVVKSDYYVRLQQHQYNATGNGSRPGSVVGSAANQSHGGGSSGNSSGSNYNYYHQSIYQSDGTPQFWGAHIYRPTQAAVAVTSR